jgi:hypothetical protein
MVFWMKRIGRGLICTQSSSEASQAKVFKKIHQPTYYQTQASRQSQSSLSEPRRALLLSALKEVYFLCPSVRRVVILHKILGSTLFFFASSASTFVNALPEICPDIQSPEVYVDLLISALRSLQKLKKFQYLGLNALAPQSNDEHITDISPLPNLRLSKFSLYPISEPLLRKCLLLSSCPESLCTLQQLDFSPSLDMIVNELPSFISPFISPNFASFTAKILMIWRRYHGIPEKQLWYKCNTLVKHARSPSRRCYSLHGPVRLSTEIHPFYLLLALHGLETLVVGTRRACT